MSIGRKDLYMKGRQKGEIASGQNKKKERRKRPTGREHFRALKGYRIDLHGDEMWGRKLGRAPSMGPDQRGRS